MKTRTPLVASVMVVWLLSLANASAFYDPGLLYWFSVNVSCAVEA